MEMKSTACEGTITIIPRFLRELENKSLGNVYPLRILLVLENTLSSLGNCSTICSVKESIVSELNLIFLHTK